jgi:hypothetical protein
LTDSATSLNKGSDIYSSTKKGALMPKKKEDRIQLGKANYGLLIISAIILILGYVIMSFNEITISPILLVAAYVIIIPIALLWRPAQK